MHKEYREHIRLFRRMGVDPYRAELIALTGPSQPGYVQRAAERLLA
jgi:hypothetical protein